jgi:hypothetical protein
VLHPRLSRRVDMLAKIALWPCSLTRLSTSKWWSGGGHACTQHHRKRRGLPHFRLRRLLNWTCAQTERACNPQGRPQSRRIRAAIVVMTETSAFLARHFVSYASRDLMEAVTHAVLGLVRTHTGLMLPIVFCLAFGESLAFVSLLLPATVILVAVGGLIGAANLSFWPLWGAAAAGAAVGDWVSYWLGLHYQASIANTWPLSRHPALLTKDMLSSHDGELSGCSSVGFSARFGASCRWSPEPLL